MELARSACCWKCSNGPKTATQVNQCIRLSTKRFTVITAWLSGERCQVGRGYQVCVVGESPTHIGCTHIVPTFRVGKCPNHVRHDSSSSHVSQWQGSDLRASSTLQMTSTLTSLPGTMTPPPRRGRRGRPYDRAGGCRCRKNAVGIVRVLNGTAPAVEAVEGRGVVTASVRAWCRLTKAACTKPDDELSQYTRNSRQRFPWWALCWG